MPKEETREEPLSPLRVKHSCGHTQEYLMHGTDRTMASMESELCPQCIPAWKEEIGRLRDKIAALEAEKAMLFVALESVEHAATGEFTNPKYDPSGKYPDWLNKYNKHPVCVKCMARSKEPHQEWCIVGKALAKANIPGKCSAECDKAENLRLAELAEGEET